MKIFSKKYWTICKMDFSRSHRFGSLKGYRDEELSSAKERFQGWFPSLTPNQELSKQQEQEIQKTLLALFFEQQSTDFDLSVPPTWVIAGLCLRCYVSHAIVQACQILAQQFGDRYGFSHLDLLPVVLTDDGKKWIGLDSDRKTQLILDRSGNVQPANYSYLSVEILRTFDPTRTMLWRWANLLTRRDRELNRILWIEYHCLLETPWSRLNQITRRQLKMLSVRDRNWVEVFHEVYRRDRRKESAKGKCPDPSEQQLQEMCDRLSQRGFFGHSADQLLNQFKTIAQVIQEGKINPQLPSIPETSPSLELLEILNESRNQALLNAIHRVLLQRFNQLQNSPGYAEIADKFFPSLRLIYFEAKSQSEVARVLNMNNQSQVSRFLSCQEMINKIREQVMEELLKILLNQEYFNQASKDAEAFNNLIQHLSIYLDESVFVEAVRELKAGHNRQMNSLFAEKMRDYLSSNEMNLKSWVA